ncbi:hypothetical protein YC2023_048159 [Brassica napus]
MLGLGICRTEDEDMAISSKPVNRLTSPRWRTTFRGDGQPKISIFACKLVNNVFLVVKVMSQEYDLGDGHYKRNLSPKWFCKTSSSTPPLVLHDHVKDYNTKSTFSDSSLLARSFHRQVFIEDRKKMSFAQPLGASSGVLLCRHISSSSGKPEESSIKIDALGDVVPDGSVEAVQAMCVIMAIHDFTGFNWYLVDVCCSYGFTGEWTHVASQNADSETSLGVKS